MELIVRGSEYQDFLNCRKKWHYSWIEKIEPKRQDNKLFIGTAFHKWLENYYYNGCNKILADLLTTSWMIEQDTSGMEQTELDDMTKLLKGMAENYDKTYSENDHQWKVLATELEFIVRLDGDTYYTGTIDLVFEDRNGGVWFSDHKTVSSISMYEEKAKMDRQISRYWWALQQIAAGIGEVKNAAGKWVPFKALEGRTIEGFIYNLIAKDIPKEPKVNKPKKGQTVGDLSVDKSQKTTYEKYMAKIVELGKDPNDYTEMLEILKNKPDPFLKRVNVLRNESELTSAMWEFMYTCHDLHDIKMMVTQPTVSEQDVESMTYRNIGTQCDTMCQFKSLCQTTIEGGNVALTKNLAYKQKEEKK